MSLLNGAAMITTPEVAKQTGLTTKTLSRWVERGILPKPALRTHPNGKGNVGTWPDAVLERCQKLVALRKEGYDLDNAVIMLQRDRLNQALAVLDKPTTADILADKKVRLADGREISLLDVLTSVIIADLKASVVDRDHQPTIITGIRQENIVRRTLELIQNGYNPFLTFDGEKVRVEPDFLLSHTYDADGPTKRSLFLLPLFPAVRKFLEAVGAGDFWKQPLVTPAPKVWVQDGDTMVEYSFYLGGPRGFELLRQTASVVGATRPNKESSEHGKQSSRRRPGKQ